VAESQRARAASDGKRETELERFAPVIPSVKAASLLLRELVRSPLNSLLGSRICVREESPMAVEKVAVVTAGGSGMGAAAARRLSADGFKVAILSSSGKGEALASELGGIGVTGSNQSVEDLKRLVDLTVEKFGRIDVLVNSAGHGPRAEILAITDEQWHTGLDVYLMNVIRPTRLVTPVMAAQKSGVIINISTAWAFEPSPMFPTSAVFRAGLASYTKIFADTYAASNVRMNNVLPGWIDSLPATDERRQNVPMQRYGTSEEIAATIAFLASDGAAYITGQNIRVDGGITRAI
jgi:NAD(P)-dependent dehydrogenase (short-subunit alcohol dehydrogenase family)